MPKKLNRTALQQAAAWLLNEGGLTNEQLGAFIGKSGGYAHHIARGNWQSGIAPTPEMAQGLRLLVQLLKARAKASKDEAAMIDEIRTDVSALLTKVNNLARRIQRRGAKG